MRDVVIFGATEEDADVLSLEAKIGELSVSVDLNMKSSIEEFTPDNYRTNVCATSDDLTKLLKKGKDQQDHVVTYIFYYNPEIHEQFFTTTLPQLTPSNAKAGVIEFKTSTSVNGTSNLLGHAMAFEVRRETTTRYSEPKLLYVGHDTSNFLQNPGDDVSNIVNRFGGATFSCTGLTFVCKPSPGTLQALRPLAPAQMTTAHHPTKDQFTTPDAKRPESRTVQTPESDPRIRETFKEVLRTHKQRRQASRFRHLHQHGGQWCWMFSNVSLANILRKLRTTEENVVYLHCQPILEKLYDILTKDNVEFDSDEIRILNTYAFDERVVLPHTDFEGGFAWRFLKFLEFGCQYEKYEKQKD